MKTMKKILMLTGVIGLSTILSCNEKDLEKVNPNGVTFETYFTNDAELVAGVNSVYSLLQGFGLGAREWFLYMTSVAMKWQQVEHNSKHLAANCL